MFMWGYDRRKFVAGIGDIGVLINYLIMIIYKTRFFNNTFIHYKNDDMNRVNDRFAYIHNDESISYALNWESHRENNQMSFYNNTKKNDNIFN